MALKSKGTMEKSK